MSCVHPLFARTPRGVYITHKQAIALGMSADAVKAVSFSRERGRLLCLSYHVLGRPVPCYWNAASVINALVNS